MPKIINHVLVFENGEHVSKTFEEWFPPCRHFAPAFTEGLRGEDVLNIVAAREIFRNFIRNRRDLNTADRRVLTAEDSGNAETVAQARQYRQMLRDLPQNPAIDVAETLEQLKNLWPEMLEPSPFDN